VMSRLHFLRLILSLPLAGFLFLVSRHHRRGPGRPLPGDATLPPPPPERDFVTVPKPPPPPPGLLYGYPTPQTRLGEVQDETVYMPTASGRILSAHYGSTRTNNSGQATFHEGTDIGPTRRDRRQHALDEIYAVTDGKIAYINRIAGNSTYGIYIVLTHQEADFGEFYTLYAHLASVPSELRAGQTVARGEVIGVMGHTSSFSIPPQRAHLHLEIGVIHNQHYASWYRAQKRTPDHGTFHGHNLTGMQPLDMLLLLEENGPARFSIREGLAKTPAAFELAIHAPALPDYFRRHPSLWQGEHFRGGVMVLEVSESGIPLRGRRATAAEAAGVTERSPKVLEVFPYALGRNGRRIIITRSGQAATLTTGGQEWLTTLLYRAGR